MAAYQPKVHIIFSSNIYTACGRWGTDLRTVKDSVSGATCKACIKAATS